MILTCLPVEARVLAEMICNPEALEICDTVESADFVDMHHVMLFHAIRDAQHRNNGEVTVDGIIDAVQQRAMDWCAPAIAEKVNDEYIQRLLKAAPRAKNLNVVRADVQRLRNDRNFRESLMVRR